MKVAQVGTSMLLVNPEKKILIGERLNTNHEPGKFCAPGGKPELNEPIAAAIRRELYEETGVSLLESQIRPLGLLADCHYPDEGVHFLNMWFFAVIPTDLKVTYIEKNAEGLPKCSGWKWYGRDEIDKFPLMSSVPDAFDQFLSGEIGTVRLKTYKNNERV